MAVSPYVLLFAIVSIEGWVVAVWQSPHLVVPYVSTVNGEGMKGVALLQVATV